MAEVRSVRAAISILRFLIAEDRPLGANAIARAIELSPSSCFNLLKTLTSEQLLEFDPSSKCYVPGPGLSSLRARGGFSEQLFKSLKPELMAMARQFSCTTSLWNLVNDRLILVDFVTGGDSMNINFRPGLRLPSLIGAMGRCVAGDMLDAPQSIAATFKKLAWQNAPSLRAFMREAEEAKARGWAADVDQYVQGLTVIGAPIRAKTQEIAYLVANILLSGPKRKTEVHTIGEATLALARKASNRLKA